MSFYQKYIKKPFKTFLATFENKKLALILLIDIIFYIIFFLGFRVFTSSAKKIVQQLGNLNLAAIQDINNIDVAAAKQLLAQLQTFMASIIGAALVLILFTIVLLTIIKGYQWSKIANKKLELYDYAKLLILNIIWFAIWIIIFFIPFFFVQKETYLTKLPYLFPIIPYFTLFVYMNYAENKSIWQALKSSITEGLLKIYKYISAIIIIILFFVIPFLILKLINLQNKTIHLTIFLIILLITLAVYKLYFYNVKKET